MGSRSVNGRVELADGVLSATSCHWTSCNAKPIPNTATGPLVALRAGGGMITSGINHHEKDQMLRLN